MPAAALVRTKKMVLSFTDLEYFLQHVNTLPSGLRFFVPHTVMKRYGKYRASPQDASDKQRCAPKALVIWRGQRRHTSLDALRRMSLADVTGDVWKLGLDSNRRPVGIVSNPWCIFTGGLGDLAESRIWSYTMYHGNLYPSLRTCNRLP